MREKVAKCRAKRLIRKLLRPKASRLLFFYCLLKLSDNVLHTNEYSRPDCYNSQPVWY